MNTEIGFFHLSEVRNAAKTVLKLEAVRMVRDCGVAVAQAARDLDVHENVLRKWVKGLAADPGHAFPGMGR